MEKIQVFLAWSKSGWSLGKVGQSSRRSEVCKISLFDTNLNAKIWCLRRARAPGSSLSVLGWDNCQQVPSWHLLYHAGSLWAQWFQCKQHAGSAGARLMSTKASRAWKGLSMFTNSGILQAACLQTPADTWIPLSPSFWVSSWGVGATSSQWSTQTWHRYSTCCA